MHDFELQFAYITLIITGKCISIIIQSLLMCFNDFETTLFAKKLTIACIAMYSYTCRIIEEWYYTGMGTAHLYSKQKCLSCIYNLTVQSHQLQFHGQVGIDLHDIVYYIICRCNVATV